MHILKQRDQLDLMAWIDLDLLDQLLNLLGAQGLELLDIVAVAPRNQFFCVLLQVEQFQDLV
jgi:hypothetical protein